jgi:hypothetical protein
VHGACVLCVRSPAPATIAAFDGLSAIAMAIVVIGLMSAVGPAIRERPADLALALGAAFAGNFGLQIAAATILKRTAAHRVVASLGIIAGNRNIALFLGVLPAGLVPDLLPWIGLYQIPMYLTPLLMPPVYAWLAR